MDSELHITDGEEGTDLSREAHALLDASRPFRGGPEPFVLSSQGVTIIVVSQSPSTQTHETQDPSEGDNGMLLITPDDESRPPLNLSHERRTAPHQLLREIIRGGGSLSWPDALVIFPNWRDRSVTDILKQLGKQIVKARALLKKCGLRIEWTDARTGCVLLGLDNGLVKCPFRDAVLNIGQARELLQSGSYGDAYLLLKKALKVDPGNVEAGILLGDIAADPNIDIPDAELMRSASVLRDWSGEAKAVLSLLRPMAMAASWLGPFEIFDEFEAETNARLEAAAQAKERLDGRAPTRGAALVSDAPAHTTALNLISKIRESHRNHDSESLESLIEDLMLEPVVADALRQASTRVRKRLRRSRCPLDRDDADGRTFSFLFQMLVEGNGSLSPERFKSDSALRAYLARTIDMGVLHEYLVGDRGLPKEGLPLYFKYLRFEEDFFRDNGRRPCGHEIRDGLDLSEQDLADLCAYRKFIDPDSVDELGDTI